MDSRPSPSTERTTEPRAGRLARALSRARSRGVAMAEGIVFVPVMGLFLTINVFVYKVPATWYMIQSKTHEQALETASRNCAGGATGRQEFDQGAPMDDGQRGAAQSGDPGAINGVDSTMGALSVHDQRSVGVGRFQFTIPGDSHTICNEPPFESSVGDFAEQGFNRSQGSGP